MTATPEQLAGRTARCFCGATRPSTSEHMAFFEYRGPGSRTAAERCGACGYSKCAHDPEHMAKLVPGRDGNRRPTVVEDGRCPGFVPMPDGLPFDSYYCGCRGWN